MQKDAPNLLDRITTPVYVDIVLTSCTFLCCFMDQRGLTFIALIGTSKWVADVAPKCIRLIV